MKLGYLILFLLCGCPKPQPVPIQPATFDAQMPNCPSTLQLPVSEDVCDGLATVEGLACVSCAGGSGCFDVVDSVYCVTGTCLTDPRCTRDVNNSVNASAKKKRQFKVRK